MRTSEERVQELHRRMDNMEESSFNRRYLAICTAVCATCFAIAIAVAVFVSGLSIASGGQLSGGATASIFADNAALGYVVVALLAFCLGVVVTIFCFRLKKFMKGKRNDRAL